MRNIVPLPLMLSVAAMALAQDRSSITLKVGDPSPPIQIRKWIKGTPVSALGKGSVNVVEFWATLSEPCKESIPHLTELAHKYRGKATFTAVCIPRAANVKDDAYFASVTQFVREMGSKMDYNVGADGLSGVMARTWMDAAGQNAIPTAFVIDQKGIVAWIGHPMNGLEEAVGQVIDGTFNIKSETQKKARALAIASKIQEDTKPLAEAIEAQKFDVAATEAGKLMVKYPEHADDLAVAKFQFLLQSDEAAASAFAREVSAGRLKDKGELLNDIAWAMIDDASPLKHRDYATAVIIASRAVKASKMADPFSLDTYAYALFKSGDAKDALDIQIQAINLAVKMGKKIPAKTLAGMKDRLAKIQERAKS